MQAKDFTIHVRSKKTGMEWVERYQKETTDPEQWGRDLIEWFNSTRRENEGEREFLRVEVHGDVPPPEHNWSKTTLMTQSRGGMTSFDKMKCERCGITGKRFGLQAHVKRDSQYRAKVYARCDTTVEHLKHKPMNTDLD